MIEKYYIEIATFKLKSGVTDTDFIAAEQANRKGAIIRQKGYISRELAKGLEGEWLVILRFDTKENMDAFLLDLRQGNMHNDSAMSDFGSKIDFSTVNMAFYERQC